MEDIKKFVLDHKKEIFIGTGIYIIFKSGYNLGYGTAKGMVSKMFEELVKFSKGV